MLRNRILAINNYSYMIVCLHLQGKSWDTVFVQWRSRAAVWLQTALAAFPDSYRFSE